MPSSLALPPWFPRERITPLRLLQALLFAVLVVQGLRLAWLLVPPAPVGSPAHGVPEPMGPAALRADFDPFFPQVAWTSAVDDSGLSLHGISSGPGGASAILGGLDSGQASFRIGESVQPGLRLVAIHPDHVVIESGTGQRRLDFSSAGGGGTVARPVPASLPSAAPAAGTAPTAVDPARLLEQAGLAPREIDGRVAGYTLVPRGDGAVLRQAGLQAGDVVTSINGQALTPETYEELASQLQDQSSLEITVERDGATRTLQVPLR